MCQCSDPHKYREIARTRQLPSPTVLRGSVRETFFRPLTCRKQSQKTKKTSVVSFPLFFFFFFFLSLKRARFSDLLRKKFVCVVVDTLQKGLAAMVVDFHKWKEKGQVEGRQTIRIFLFETAFWMLRKQNTKNAHCTKQKTSPVFENKKQTLRSQRESGSFLFFVCFLSFSLASLLLLGAGCCNSGLCQSF